MRKTGAHWREGAFRKVLVLVLAFCCAGCGITKNISEAEDPEITPTTTSYTTTAASLNTPQKIFDWMLVNIHYNIDQSLNDEFRPAEVTYERRSGDCDDYALFAQTILTSHGYETEILSIFNRERGHAICVWRERDGTYNYLSNINIYYIHAGSYAEIAAAVYKDWDYYQIYSTKENIVRNS